MSTYVTVASACGRTSGAVDIFDLPLNRHGIICCGECEGIIQSREAWDDYEDEDYWEEHWGMDDSAMSDPSAKV